MGREAYQVGMEQRLRDLSLQIDSVRSRLMDSPHDGLRMELAAQLSWLEHRRDSVREKLDALSDEPDGTWEDLKAEVEDEWDALIQDFEERVANLA
ncbi:MAG: phasin family protein [Magnetospirillum sp.]|nr:phasin family protein [Magnetospirillum sp.]